MDNTNHGGGDIDNIWRRWLHGFKKTTVAVQR